MQVKSETPKADLTYESQLEETPAAKKAKTKLIYGNLENSKLLIFRYFLEFICCSRSYSWKVEQDC